MFESLRPISVNVLCENDSTFQMLQKTCRGQKDELLIKGRRALIMEAHEAAVLHGNDVFDFEAVPEKPPYRHGRTWLSTR